jgi:hypothetical protein
MIGFAMKQHKMRGVEEKQKKLNAVKNLEEPGHIEDVKFLLFILT